ncbi:hypothetical protein SAMN05216490_0768 [Mucilaginibacter mallensis]|uniref:Uncharacterized protein n=1 Tax=Mucilaginibacter mallensis TaxID=652787 RepID=A0A1H1QGZ5_MUCMA|nr:hypothetical protein [Mucilaginibacter mallensis]SDS22577.1 hypothetical protein SAMN05216490_0768 [Mucilaginibacter mallensis]
MTLSDVSLIGKKILVGIIITLVPFIIIVGGLFLTQKLLQGNSSQPQPAVKQIKTNKS